jgi:hypothetical protein
MKPAALCPAVSRSIRGILLASAVAVLPASALAQHGGAGAHAGAAHSGGMARPAVARPSTGSVARPVGAAPIIRPLGSGSVLTRPIISGPGVAPVVPFRPPTTSAGMFLPGRLPRQFPPSFGFTGLPGSAAYFAYNPFLLRTCGAFAGLAYGCGVLPPYFGFGYGPAGIYPTIFPPDTGYPSAYPPDTGYPSAPVYPSEPPYNPPDPLATLQYSPLLNQQLAAFPPQDLAAAGAETLPVRSETLLYLKDGSVFAVASYTVSNGTLHYVTAYSDRGDVSVDQLDVQKTIQANAARGVAFTLTPAPGVAPGDSKPTPLGPSPAPEGPITPAKQ